MELVCKWCYEIKPAEDFIRRKASVPYSQANVRCCRECNRKRNRQRYEIPLIREKQLFANSKWRKENADRQNTYCSKWAKSNPERQKARNKVGYMIKHGYWSRQPCEICGTINNVEAHHDSYDEAHWLTVRWLCKNHHEAWHQEIDQEKREIITAPLERAKAIKEEYLLLMHQSKDIALQARKLKSEAEKIEFDAWSEVLKISTEKFKEFRNKK